MAHKDYVSALTGMTGNSWAPPPTCPYQHACHCRQPGCWNIQPVRAADEDARLDRLGAKGCMHPAVRDNIYTHFHQLPRLQGHRGALSRYSPAQYHLHPLVGPNAWAGRRRGSAGAAPVLTPAADNGYRRPLTINRSRFQLRGEKGRGILSQAQMSYASPKAQRDPALHSARIQTWALLGAFGAAAAQRADGHRKIGLERAGGCLGAPGLSEFGTALGLSPASLVTHLCSASEVQGSLAQAQVTPKGI